MLALVQVLAIDGNVVDEGWNGDRAAQFLRGTSGTSVRVRLARRSAGKVPGVASRPEVPIPVPTRSSILLRPSPFLRCELTALLDAVRSRLRLCVERRVS